MRFELTTPTLARLCSTPELRPRSRRNHVRRGGYIAHVRRLCKPLLRLTFPVAIARLRTASGLGKKRPWWHEKTMKTDDQTENRAPSGSPASKEGLLTLLEDLGIAATTIDHPPLHAVDDAQACRAANLGAETGGFCKNLFLKDKKGVLWLVVTLEERNIRLNSLPKSLGSARLSFAKPELLWETLGVRPGSVTPFALINDVNRQVRLILDAPMMEHDWLNYHPLTNEATTTISKGDFLKFIRHCGHEPTIIDLEAAAGL